MTGLAQSRTAWLPRSAALLRVARPAPGVLSETITTRVDGATGRALRRWLRRHGLAEAALVRYLLADLLHSRARQSSVLRGLGQHGQSTGKERERDEHRWPITQAAQAGALVSGAPPALDL